jgi:exopolysaccharide/PEP-CTERM locus tyrosine autokinase
LGKISKALNKYAKERQDSTAAVMQAPSQLPLKQADYDALVNYDRFTGHLLQNDRTVGHINGDAIQRLRQDGTIQRLLENKLIYTTGKLTPRGEEEAARLERLGLAVRRMVEPPPPPVRASVPDVMNPPAVVDEEDEYIAAYDSMAPEMATQAPVPQPSPPLAEAKAPPAPAATKAPAPVRPVPDIKKAPALAVAPPKDFQSPVSLSIVEEGNKRFDASRIDRTLVALHTPQSYEAEQFKILRTNILYPVAGQPPRSILITSTAPGEGKTFTAANLAISIASNINKHVLLIDADLRRPQLHRRFGFEDIPGLSDYLERGVPLPSLLVKTSVEKLTLLPGGAAPANPSELISSERMANLIAEVTGRYADRLILIDAPPPTLAAETGVLARQVDGILVVVRFGETQREELSDLIKQMGAPKIIGSVVNHLETTSSRYYGYKYGGHRKQKPN